MDIINIAGSTRVFGAPKDWNAERDGPCGGLPIRDEAYAPGVNRMVSEWKPNEIELEHLKLGAPLQLGVLGAVHPVVSLGVGAPPAPPAEGFEEKMSKIQRLMTDLEEGPWNELREEDNARVFRDARSLILALLGISAKPVGEQIAAALDARVRAECPDEPGDLDTAVKFARRWLPECFPADDNGQVPFARALVESVLDAAEGHLKREVGSGQGEPVAWRVGNNYGIHVYDGDRPVATFHSTEDAARAVAAVNAAPASSRPADREAEAIIVGWHSIEKLALEGEVRFAESPVVLIAASDLFGNDISALRDAPRDGGDEPKKEDHR